MYAVSSMERMTSRTCSRSFFLFWSMHHLSLPLSLLEALQDVSLPRLPLAASPSSRFLACLSLPRLLLASPASLRAHHLDEYMTCRIARISACLYTIS
jgi:hypothetical protein